MKRFANAAFLVVWFAMTGQDTVADEVSLAAMNGKCLLARVDRPGQFQVHFTCDVLEGKLNAVVASKPNSLTLPGSTVDEFGWQTTFNDRELIEVYSRSKGKTYCLASPAGDGYSDMIAGLVAGSNYLLRTRVWCTPSGGAPSYQYVLSPVCDSPAGTIVGPRQSSEVGPVVGLSPVLGKRRDRVVVLSTDIHRAESVKSRLTLLALRDLQEIARTSIEGIVLDIGMGVTNEELYAIYISIDDGHRTCRVDTFDIEDQFRVTSTAFYPGSHKEGWWPFRHWVCGVTKAIFRGTKMIWSSDSSESISVLSTVSLDVVSEDTVLASGKGRRNFVVNEDATLLANCSEQNAFEVWDISRVSATRVARVSVSMSDKGSISLSSELLNE